MRIPTNLIKGIQLDAEVSTITIVYKGKEYQIIDSLDARALITALAKEQYAAQERTVQESHIG
jgi:hypothetical protein